MPQPRKYPTHAARQAAYHKRCQDARKQELTDRGIPALPAIPTIPGAARWAAAMQKAQTLLDMVAAEMQDYSDDRSEAWQEGERGVAFQERLTAIEAICSDLADACMA